MRPSLWAEIHRLYEVEKLSQRQIAKRLGLSRSTVRETLTKLSPPGEASSEPRPSKLDPFKEKINDLLASYPSLTAVRVKEIIDKDGYQGGRSIMQEYVSQVRPQSRRRVYQSVPWEPGEAMQVDWADCDKVAIDGVQRKVSVFGCLLMYSRLLYIEFTLDQKKETFYRCIVHALESFGGSPRNVIIDNLKAGVLDGHGRQAHFHPEFLDLCGYYRMQAVACQRRDPESKGGIEAALKYVQTNALPGRELKTFAAYGSLAREWLEKVNHRIHRTTEAVPAERLAKEELLPLPEVAYDCRLVKQCKTRSHAIVIFEANSYSVPPAVANQPVTLKADASTVWIYFQTDEVARHRRNYGRKQQIIDPAHRAAALALRKRERDSDLLARFKDLGMIAEAFHEGLVGASVRRTHHIREIMRLVPLYGCCDVLQAMETATAHRSFDAAAVKYLIEQKRRQLAKPSPLPLSPIRKDLLETIDIPEPDPGIYDQWIEGDDDDESPVPA